MKIMFNGLITVVALLSALAVCAGEERVSNQISNLDLILGHEKVTAGGTYEPSRMVLVDGLGFDQEVRIWLPPAYHASEKRYPTLWVTDNALEMAVAGTVASRAGISPDVIIVSVGPAVNIGSIEFLAQREVYFGRANGGAEKYLSFIVDKLRPKLETEYRMDPTEHTLVGHSGGGAFGLFTLFSRPESFSNYIISSPDIGTGKPWVEIEQEYFESHKDLSARVFLVMGELEFSEYFLSAAKVGTSFASVAEQLTLHQYPSLDLTVRVIPGEGHGAMAEAYRRGINHLFKPSFTIDKKFHTEMIQEAVRRYLISKDHAQVEAVISDK